MKASIPAKGLILFILFFAAGCSKDDGEITGRAAISIEAVDVPAIEEGEEGKFIISLTERLTIAIQISINITGTASNGEDYETITSTITMPANRLTLEIVVQAIDDEHSEEDEQVTITLVNVDNSAVNIGDPNEATMTISDTGGPPPAFVLGPGDTRSYMVNPNATDETVALFYNLKVLSETQFIVGQQDAFNAFYNNGSGDSDMKKTTGSDPGLLGSDFMFITDDENDETPENWYFQQEQVIKADAVEAYNKGMVNIFCWHLREPYEGDEFYTENMTEFHRNNAFKSILPGGANHGYYKQKLDKVAQVAQSMVGDDGKLVPFIFRPFHEFDGNWFWWGQAYCTAQEFITVWRFTVEYLRDTKGVNNILFAFSPDNHFTSEGTYLSRYPGDDYVDIFGMDNYGDFNNQGEAGVENANAKLQIVSTLALERVKIAALTESCYFVTPGENTPISGFYSEYLYDAVTKNNVQIGFMMFWNNNLDSYCVPPPGQSSTNDFIEFANKPASALASDLPDMYNLPAG